METISRGAQFKGLLSSLGLIFMVISLIALIFGIAESLWLIVFLAAPMIAISLSLFLGIQGLQIDLTQRKIRAYKQFLWLKSGEWRSLQDYNGVHLVKDSFGVALYGGTSMRRGIKISTYDVLLIAHDTRYSILMSEFAKHPDAVKFMEVWAAKLSLEPRDTYRELQASAVRNRQGRR